MARQKGMSERRWRHVHDRHILTLSPLLPAVALFLCSNLAVVAVFAAGFFDLECAKQGLARVQQEDGSYICDDIGLQGAGTALKSLLGHSASTVWAIGLLAAGQSSTMTGTFAGQYVMEGFLTMKIAPWKRVAITRSIALVPAVTVAILGASSSKTSDTLDEYLNILQSIQLPFALLPILHFTNSRRVMGDEFVNSPRFKAFGWLTVTAVIIINFYLVGSQILDVHVSGLPDTWWMYFILAIIIAAYLGTIVFIVSNDVRYAVAWVRRRGGWDAHSAASGDRTTASLEAEFDQPQAGSPAWLVLQNADDGQAASVDLFSPPHLRQRTNNNGDHHVFLPVNTNSPEERSDQASEQSPTSAERRTSPYL